MNRALPLGARRSVRPVRALRLLEAVLDFNEVEARRVERGRLVGESWREEGEEEEEDRGEGGRDRVAAHAVRDGEGRAMRFDGGEEDEEDEKRWSAESERVGARVGLERV